MHMVTEVPHAYGNRGVSCICRTMSSDEHAASAPALMATWPQEEAVR